MANSDPVYAIEDEEQLWIELDKVVATQCHADDHGTIDDALRSWLYLTSRYREEFSVSEDDVASCSHCLLKGELFQTSPEYVRTQIIYSLLQEEEPGPLYVIASFLLLDGRNDETTFKMMVQMDCFHRLLELIIGRKETDPDLHRLLLELMYAMSRIEQLRIEDLLHVDDAFVTYLFKLIEEFSDDAQDPYHYAIIRVLLVLNEQYMVVSTTAVTNSTSPPAPLTNKVVKCLGLRGSKFRTFGENIILLLNRETETSLQLLILKLLYLLFTTKATYEYFYTNDLRVLLDVIIRNLLDLPNEMISLRHTYLRVLYPLLAHTQLNQPPHYKKDEILKVIRILADSDNTHFAPADETTLRLVDRVSKVKWLTEEGTGSGELARKLIGISLSPTVITSNSSVVDVAAVMEKPGVQTPSRKTDAGAEAENGVVKVKSNGEVKEPPKPPRARKPLPAVPKHRHGTPYAPLVHKSENGSGSSTTSSKRPPPKAPPPRRKGRLKSTVSNSQSLAYESELV
ncbi:hypothetical protein F5B20DRAFT_510231 [Whalleya microplaca]|nr:hypothetical protein F5B20DRAFT_510231 [Whalleya microplaca]